MAFTDLSDVRLFLTDDGPAEPGRTLLLVHGWGSDSHEWVHHIGPLAERHRVLAPDLRGHGASSVPDTPCTPAAMAADLARLVEGVGAAPLTAVGHSMGGQVVSLLAADRPDLVEAVVTVDPGYGFGPDETDPLPAAVRALNGPDPVGTALALDAWSTTPATPGWIRTWHERRLRAARPRVLAEAFAGMFTDPGAIGPRPAAQAHLARRPQPALSLWHHPGRADWERPLLPPGSRVECWEGAGHRLHEERPAEFLRALEGWLAGTDHER